MESLGRGIVTKIRLWSAQYSIGSLVFVDHLQCTFQGSSFNFCFSFLPFSAKSFRSYDSWHCQDFFPKRSFLSCIIEKLNDLPLHDSSMFVFLKIILSFSFRSFFDTLIFYRFVFKAAIPEEIHANQELFTESLAIFREERYGGSHLFEISEANRQFSSVPYFSRSNSFGSQKHKGKKS